MVLATRPVMLKDLAISVEKPSTSTPVTNATSMRSTLAWKARTPGRKASWSSQGGGSSSDSEEIAQDLRRLAQNLVLLLDAGPDEVVQDGGRQRRELLHDRIEHGVADDGVPDVVVGGSPIVVAGLRMALRVR